MFRVAGAIPSGDIKRVAAAYQQGMPTNRTFAEASSPFVSIGGLKSVWEQASPGIKYAGIGLGIGAGALAVNEWGVKPIAQTIVDTSQKLATIPAELGLGPTNQYTEWALSKDMLATQKAISSSTQLDSLSNLAASLMTSRQAAQSSLPSGTSGIAYPQPSGTTVVTPQGGQLNMMPILAIGALALLVLFVVKMKK